MPGRREGSRSTSIRLLEAPAVERDCVRLLGVAVDRLSFADVLGRVGTFISEGAPHRIVTVNLDYLRLASRDEAFRETLNGADLAVADGMPVVWGAKLAGRALPERVTGLDLFQAICERGAGEGWSVFLLGAAPGVAAVAADVLEERYPGLRVAGSYSPPVGAFDALEEAHIRGLIRAARPDVLFVALGAPRQDLWIRESLDHTGVPVAIGVGCAFDVVSGRVARAPLWMQHRGLEWLFRLSHEPRRLWKRYLTDAPALFSLGFDALVNRGRAEVRRLPAAIPTLVERRELVGTAIGDAALPSTSISRDA